MVLQRHEILPGEEVLVEIRPHWMYLIGPSVTTLAVIGVMVGLDVGFPHASPGVHWVEGIAAAVPCAWLVARFIRWRRSSVVVTSHRIIEEHGVMTRSGWEVHLDHIERVEVVQSMLRRMLGTGRLEVTTWGDAGVLVLEDVRKPVVLWRVINRRLGPPEAGTP